MDEIARLIKQRDTKAAAATLNEIAKVSVVRELVPKLYETLDRDMLILMLRAVIETTERRFTSFICSLYVSRCYLELNCAGSALRYIRPWLKVPPGLERHLLPADYHALRMQSARVFSRSGRPDQAQELLSETLLFAPSTVEALLLLASLQKSSDGDYPRILRRALLASGGKSYAALSSCLENLIDARLEGEFMDTLTSYANFHKKRPELHLNQANFELAHARYQNYNLLLANFFRRLDLLPPPIRTTSEAGFANLTLDGPVQPAEAGPLVTIIMTSFNSAAYIEMAIRSVLQQTYGNIELYVVDDGSTDDSIEIVSRLQQQDSRIRLLKTPKNGGTYFAKNLAIDHAAGEFVTFHDSDDWMHPQRIEFHVKEFLKNTELICLTSDWIRMDWEGRAIVRRTGGFLHMNPASTMVRKSTLLSVGRFDSVRAGADSEFHWRLKRNFGSKVAHLQKPLAIGLHRSDSLTMNSITGFDENRFSPVRLKYWESWTSWHLRLRGRGKRIVLDQDVAQRPYEVPDVFVV
jgi:hypothetical protein